MTRYCRVHKLTIKTDAIDGKTFIHCSCCFRNRIGLPFSCFWKLLDLPSIDEVEKINMTMVDVRYWKLYDAFYGDDTDLGKSLYKGQEQCMRYEKMGTLVNASILSKVSTYILFHVTLLSYHIYLFIGNDYFENTIRLMPHQKTKSFQSEEMVLPWRISKKLSLHTLKPLAQKMI